ncbi:GNAT family N-acetyltransferase [Rhizobium sp. TRM96647]|uniref:GNAT family N-acetyltransferase n=1 Tax=unclassified Rhizobium TaxID=2613769 RepID=UPI0021E79E32|nr:MULTISPECIES: GNAT family N-acetyltransferase [unclassified Rhizobium]MCV3737482.1 GNAT family N-acetyltransferase [Rhizobium sp. TRM96647]MCV3756428.1 GNAT family N-acetyltransferase [Rhizobium sp. TRM96650]
MTTSPAYTVDVRRLEEFSAVDLYAMLKMRVDVFVVEQNCPYPELDGNDPACRHLRLLNGTDLLACARLWRPVADALPRIGRVAVSPDHRGKRLGDALMREAIVACERLYPNEAIALSAQSHLTHFYEAFGFSPTSEEYLEDGIPHVDMLRPPSPGNA